MIERKHVNFNLIFLIEIVLIILSIVASVNKICIGMDIDEAYITTMGIRMLEGDAMFRDMWELHQTSAWPAYIVLSILLKTTGTLNRAVLTLRFVSILFSALVAIIFYFVMSKYFKNCILVSLFIFNFLPRGTQNFEYGYLTCMFILLSSVILFYLIQEKEKLKFIKIIFLSGISGCLASAGWICYPTMCITVFAVFFLFISRKYRNSMILGGYLTI